MRARRIAALTAGVALVGTEAVLLRHHLAAAIHRGRHGEHHVGAHRRRRHRGIDERSRARRTTHVARRRTRSLVPSDGRPRLRGERAERHAACRKRDLGRLRRQAPAHLGRDACGGRLHRARVRRAEFGDILRPRRGRRPDRWRLGRRVRERAGRPGNGRPRRGRRCPAEAGAGAVGRCTRRARPHPRLGAGRRGSSWRAVRGDVDSPADA